MIKDFPNKIRQKTFNLSKYLWEKFFSGFKKNFFFNFWKHLICFHLDQKIIQLTIERKTPKKQKKKRDCTGDTRNIQSSLMLLRCRLHSDWLDECGNLCKISGQNSSAEYPVTWQPKLLAHIRLASFKTSNCWLSTLTYCPGREDCLCIVGSYFAFPSFTTITSLLASFLWSWTMPSM